MPTKDDIGGRRFVPGFPYYPQGDSGRREADQPPVIPKRADPRPHLENPLDNRGGVNNPRYPQGFTTTTIFMKKYFYVVPHAEH